MLIVVDECVPPSIADLFVQRGHREMYVRKEMGRGTKDPIIAANVDKLGAVLLTENYKHFLPLMASKTSGGAIQFPSMGLITYRCPPKIVLMRFAMFMDAIEYHYDFARRLTDKRINVQVCYDRFVVFR